MKYFLFFPLIALLALTACNSAGKQASEKTVQDFYAALRKEDSTKIKQFYPDFEKLGGYYKSEKIEILSTEENEGFIEVKVSNSFTNLNGEKFDQEITYLCKENKKKPGSYIIADSKGIYAFDETREYQFAVQTGFIPKKNDLTDQQKAAKILKSQDLLEILFKEKMESLRKEVVIENWGWEYGYTETYANGHGTVVNRSNEDFGTLKFQLTFVAQDGSVTKTDDGYLGYDTLRSGASRDFTTISSDIGNAVKAYIQIEYDSFELLEKIYAARYKGNEFRLLK
ncbi:MAG: hypothetical protein K0R65_942 [Crocinitomicaceae bacterium]|jgi:hypothetical protein|nr:hypothetical protein [Crocinitomicaceae bacterium]